jgi:hypothetical protein
MVQKGLPWSALFKVLDALVMHSGVLVALDVSTAEARVAVIKTFQLSRD